MNWRKYITKADLTLIITLALVSLASLILILFSGNNKANEMKAEKMISVQIDGKQVDWIPLIPENEGKRYPYKTQYGTNTVEIINQKVHILEADCPDQLCIHQGFIDQSGQILVCLPHRLVVEIQESGKNQQSGIDAMVR